MAMNLFDNHVRLLTNTPLKSIRIQIEMRWSQYISVAGVVAYHIANHLYCKEKMLVHVFRTVFLKKMVVVVRKRKMHDRYLRVSV